MTAHEEEYAFVKGLFQKIEDRLDDEAPEVLRLLVKQGYEDLRECRVKALDSVLAEIAFEHIDYIRCEEIRDLIAQTDTSRLQPMRRNRKVLPGQLNIF